MVLTICKIDAPISYTPTFVRDGGILVLGGKCSNNVMDGLGYRVALIFPTPKSNLKAAVGDSLGASGSFTLVEDDGITNDHMKKSTYCELRLSFQVSSDHDQIIIDVDIIHRGYQVPYKVIWFLLPQGDERKMVGKGGTDLQQSSYHDGRTMAGVAVGTTVD